ncbi:MAG: manganese efflux pump MntP family protein [Eubacteriales bacterium]|nr:manganese efflux pump MntP family protein [Eubacteriales bacterium]
MDYNISFFLTALGLGVGLAMDAFSVSLANGLAEPSMKIRKMTCVAGVFGIFQGIMPLIGWVCVHTLVTYFTVFQKFIPYIALILLAFIGGKMIYEGIKGEDEVGLRKLTFSGLMIQGVATSIDALSVGFTISGYNVWGALLNAGIIAFMTFLICFAGIIIGKNLGTRLKGKASVLGGVILVLIGLEIFVSSFFSA